MATIRPIEGRSVHQIQSGQVIVDLSSVVKELVENSLDAGATSIDVRFKNHGLDSIEVQDNGKGIAPEDFETIALKHHTSKLSSYEDLTSLETFGFRGEALSSLCALSDFHIVTARSEDGAMGQKLDFEVSGKLSGTSVVAAQKGTTVSVENLFHSLPVRRKELEKNVKREYGKVLQHLQAYACISTGVRFSVGNQMPKARKLAVFSTKANTTTKENITNVFGAKATLALVKLDLELEMETTNGPLHQNARNGAAQSLDRSRQVHIQGHISRPVFGEGRQAPDRQMFFVNSRPCGLPQVSKAVNEVYKSFNVSQSPFIFANLVMDTNAYDVNVSPDKRSIMLHDQTALLEGLKAALTELFQKTDHTVPQSHLPSRKLPGYKTPTIQRPHVAESSESSSDNEQKGGLENDSNEAEAIAREKLSKNDDSIGGRQSPIEIWAGRDSELRSEKTAPKPRSVSLCEEKVAPMRNRQWEQSKEIQAPAVNGIQTAADKHAVSVLQDPDPMSTSYDDLFSQRPPLKRDPLQAFNALMDRKFASQAPSTAVTETQVPEPGLADYAEPTIPAVSLVSQRNSPGPVQSAFDRMRPVRTPLQTAEITVGGRTTTATIGDGPPYKKRRLHDPADSQAITRFGGSPLLARGLRAFAAPGTQLDAMDESETAPWRVNQTVSEDKASDLNSQTQSEEGLARSRSEKREEETSDLSDDLECTPIDDVEPDGDLDDDYHDERERKIKEDEKVARLIQEAELAAAQPTEQNLRRASQVLRNGGNRKESTLQLTTNLDASIRAIGSLAADLCGSEKAFMRTTSNGGHCGNTIVKDELDNTNAESQLSLTVSKNDFASMQIIGQFNLGFILALRSSSVEHGEDDLFIIDQHAADEKYNYERLQRTVTLESQRLVRPKALDLTAVEEEIVWNHAGALRANGFDIQVIEPSATQDRETDYPARRTFRLFTLPLAGAKTFDLSDLDELLHLLSDLPTGSVEVPRPRKVQRMLAMRACRSSIMVGRTLTVKQMERVVRQMGEMDKPWNCPHGRPTMRHLARLGAWVSWKEGDSMHDEQDGGMNGQPETTTDWMAWLQGKK